MSAPERPGERSLGAVMFTDVVGYSSMASADEARALRLLEEHRGALRPLIAGHHGKEVKTIGDAFLVEFASAVEAVNCAAEMQGAMAKLNAPRRPEERLQVRIGVHVGDIVHSEGDVLGDAVNVAARVEPLAEPGGICVTRQVVDNVERKVNLRFVSLGRRDLKNISYPVEVFKVETSSGAKGEGEGMDPRRVAILPFANLSSDPNDKYFADGMTEELISTVSNIGELSVISRTSVMRYKDSSVPIGEIGRELSVGTVLEGSVRKAGNKVRVTTQLIDARSDRHLWAQSYDRDLTDIFAIQGDIAGRVAEALRVKLVSKEKDAIEKKATGNLEAYTLYLQGRQAWNERSKEGLEKAVRRFKEAIALDSGFALAYSGLADCYSIMEDRSILPYSEVMPLATSYAEKAVELDDSLAEGHTSLGMAFEKRWDFAGAEREFKRAISLKPNYVTAQHWYSLLLGMLGKEEEAYEAERRALELDPLSSIVRQGIGVALLYLGRYDESQVEFDRVIEFDPDFASAYYWKSWCLYMLKDIEGAIALAKKCIELSDSPAGPESQLVWLYLKAGRREPALKILEGIGARGGYQSASVMATIKFGLGAMDEGYALLERAYLEHEGFLIYFREFPWFEEYRSDPRWTEIERKMGLPSL